MQRQRIGFMPSRISSSVGLGVVRSSGCGREDLPVLAEPALRHLLIDPGLLDGMQLPVLGQSLQGRNLAVATRNRQDARADRAPVHQHRARPALGKAAAEARSPQPEIVPQDVQERRRRIDVERMGLAVDPERGLSHRCIPPPRGRSSVQQPAGSWLHSLRACEPRQVPRSRRLRWPGTDPILCSSRAISWARSAGLQASTGRTGQHRGRRPRNSRRYPRS